MRTNWMCDFLENSQAAGLKGPVCRLRPGPVLGPPCSRPSRLLVARGSEMVQYPDSLSLYFDNPSLPQVTYPINRLFSMKAAALWFLQNHDKSSRNCSGGRHI